MARAIAAHARRPAIQRLAVGADRDSQIASVISSSGAEGASNARTSPLATTHDRRR